MNVTERLGINLNVAAYITWLNNGEYRSATEVFEYLFNYVQDKEVIEIIESEYFKTSLTPYMKVIYILFYLETLDTEGKIYSCFVDMTYFFTKLFREQRSAHFFKTKVEQLKFLGLFFDDPEDNELVVVTNKRLFHALKRKEK